MPGFVAEQLWKPENRGLQTVLKAAEKYRVPPSLFLDKGKTDPSEWTERDKKLVLGWQTLQDETCGTCGTPVWWGHSEDPYIEFDLKTTTCYGCAELDRAQNSKEPELPPGTTRYVNVKAVEVEGEDTKLPTRLEGLSTSK